MHKGPHISIAPAVVVSRILRIPPDDFAEWPFPAQETAREIAEELFLVAYNPFVNPETVRASVNARLERDLFPLAHHYATSISEGVTIFWSAHDSEQSFRRDLTHRLADVLPANAIVSRPGDLVACATDATDLRMELPLLVVEPETPEQVSALVRLANEMKFALVPRGGASGMTGGAVPARKRCVVVRLSRLTRQCVADSETMTLLAGAGVITQTAIDAAARAGLLFTVDPASKTTSTIGGNIAENSGGPFAFEYGTTLDNLLSWRMVTPTGERIAIERMGHPRRKIEPHETAVFEVRDMSGGLRSVIELRGDEIRLPGLGKDVTNKALGGLPGMQKEGVDGIITDATFILHKKPGLTRVLVLECYGASLHNAAALINRLIDLRDTFRRSNHDVRLSAIEEFNISYIRAIDYKPKAENRQGLPISVILVKAEGDHEGRLDRFVAELRGLVQESDDTACIVAANPQEAELFWEDRHRLSAIAKRTSGFKINEDVVIPVARIADFALFLERLNAQYLATSYAEALEAAATLCADPDLVIEKQLAAQQVTEQQSVEVLENRIDTFFESLYLRHPAVCESLGAVVAGLHKNRLVVASHMHAGDGNCHVNIPVNSNNLHMVALAEEAAERVMNFAVELGGAVSGEHGIGITKIAFLPAEKLAAIRLFKERVDPRDVFNPAKLTRRTLPVRPFTFSFNRLIADVRQSALPDKNALIGILAGVQDCTRCGKCRLVCPMMCPEKSFHYAPRNKNMMLGALMESIAYTRHVTGTVPQELFDALRLMTDHCTTCGRCTSVCPVKIESAEVTLRARAYLTSQGAGGSMVKLRILDWIGHNPASRAPSLIKMASFGQRMQNRVLSAAPLRLRRRLANPLLSGKGPAPNYSNMYEVLRTGAGHAFCGKNPTSQAVLYFPGCGGALVTRSIGLSALALLLRTGTTVILPPQHLCCGYPLLTSGADTTYEHNRRRNAEALQGVLDWATERGLEVSHLLTACGSCREGLDLQALGCGHLHHEDVVQFVLPRLNATVNCSDSTVLQHVSCHPEWSGLPAVRAIHTQTAALSAFSGVKIQLSPHCCGESGMGAIASPHVFNPIRARKESILLEQVNALPHAPILVGCPSCRMGIGRALLDLRLQREVLHTAEWLALQVFGDSWIKNFPRSIERRAGENGVRAVTCFAENR